MYLKMINFKIKVKFYKIKINTFFNKNRGCRVLSRKASEERRDGWDA
jgi:hypothetical protein